MPRRLRRLEGSVDLGGALKLPENITAGVEAAIDRLRAEMEAAGFRLGEGAAPLTLERRAGDPTSFATDSSEAYRLDLDADGVRLIAPTDAGLSHGVSTLVQWIALHGGSRAVPAVSIEDAPRLPHRGVMLDISRSRVPNMARLERLIDRLASWKINQLQLYVEHTFAYAGHEAVWLGASPLTPAEARRLDDCCRARHIELVPNQNSFGHLHRWLELDRYRPLAECPDGIEHPFADHPTPFSLCPDDPRSLELLDDLYGQLLPNFTSRRLHIGFDETLDLGLGRSRERVERLGVGRVYAEFLDAVVRLAAGHGRRVQFWGDIVSKHPEILSLVPDDATVMEWGYETDHPFAERATRLAEAHVDFYVCPGTSSWLSFAGRWGNAVANITEAVRTGIEHGASGVLVTDWGDQGHLQPPVTSLPGYLLAAALAWNPGGKSMEHADSMRRLLDLWAFDRTPGRPATDDGPATPLLSLAEIYALPGGSTFNGSPLFYLLTHPDLGLGEARLRGVTTSGLELVRERLDAIGSVGGGAGAEIAWIHRVIATATRLGLHRLRYGAIGSCRELPSSSRAELSARLDAVIEEHRSLWKTSSRPGGLEESARYLERTRDALASSPW